MALAAQSKAVVWGSDHDREELHDWISIGVPIQSESTPFQGVLGVLISDWPFNVDTISVLCAALKQIVESALYVTAERKQREALESLLAQTVNLWPDGYLVLSGGEVWVMNDLAESILKEDNALLPFLLNHVQSGNRPVSEVYAPTTGGQSLIEVKAREQDGIFHVFLKRVPAPAAKPEPSSAIASGSQLEAS